MGDTIAPTSEGSLVVRSYEYAIPDIIGYPNGVAVDLNNIHFLAWVSESYQGPATRPILNVCELDKAFGVDELVHPYVRSVKMTNSFDCTQSKIIDIKIQNIGTGAINSMAVALQYGSEIYSTEWEGELLPNDCVSLLVPVIALFGTNPLEVLITKVNGQSYNHSTTTSVSCMEWADLEMEGDIGFVELELVQDKFGEQITWEFTASDGTVLSSGGPYNTLVGSSGTLIHVEQVALPLNACVVFTIYDAGENGICCNSGQGYYVVRDSHGNVLFGDQNDGDFGMQASHLISVKSHQVGIEGEVQSMQLFPNPVKDLLNIQGIDMTRVEVYNAIGQFVMSEEVNGNTAQIKMESLNNGIYFLRVHVNDGNVLNRTFSVAR